MILAHAAASELTLFMVDLDHFKRINDTYGHRIGDEALHHVADLLRKTMRRTDFLFRYGGEEFAVIHPGTTKEDAVQRADALRRALLRILSCQADKSLRLSLFLGVLRRITSVAESGIRLADDEALAALTEEQRCASS